MKHSDNTEPGAATVPGRANAIAVLAREAGVPFQPPLSVDSRINPIAEWLSLMEVVEMLCPVWPVRDTPMQGDHWKI
jgi:hypothetical protein